jgi:SAM-dependent methyltransferase
MSFYDVWVRWENKAVRSFRQRGVVGTLEFTLVLVKEGLSSRWRHYSDQKFDRRFAVDTADTSIPPEFESDPRFKYGHAYGPTPRSLFFRMLRKLEVDYSKFLFIDFGCGKGKALLLAAELHFRQIIGVELSSKLIDVAEENLKTYLGRTRERDIFKLVRMDARQYPIPQEPAIYYFANPFEAEVMRSVLENIRSSLAPAPRGPSRKSLLGNSCVENKGFMVQETAKNLVSGRVSRESYIVYLEPVLQALLDESGFLAPIKKSALYSIWKVTACPTRPPGNYQPEH